MVLLLKFSDFNELENDVSLSTQSNSIGESIENALFNHDGKDVLIILLVVWLRANVFVCMVKVVDDDRMSVWMDNPSGDWHDNASDGFGCFTCWFLMDRALLLLLVVELAFMVVVFELDDGIICGGGVWNDDDVNGGELTGLFPSPSESPPNAGV